MRKIDRGKVLFIIFLFSFAVLIAITSLQYEMKARIIPLSVSVLALLLGIPVLMNEIHPTHFLASINFDLVDVAEKSAVQKEVQQEQGRALIIMILWIFGFFALSFFFGFHAGIPLFSFLYLKLHSRSGWLVSLLFALLLWSAHSLLFELIIGFELFKGVFFGEILPSI